MKIELKIELLGTSNPTVWRQIKVSPEITFHQLHEIIQAAFGWKSSHLYQFSENGFRDLISIGSPRDEEGVINGAVVSASPLLFRMYNGSMFDKERAPKLRYIYDFGDSWEHEISVLDFDRTPGVKTELVDGGGACPPEDCGGIPGFQDLKICLKTGKPSAIHGGDWKSWLDGVGYVGYEVDGFDLKVARRGLAKLK